MGERDAFGREIGEDPLAGLGAPSAPPPASSVTPSAEAPPAPAPASPSAKPKTMPPPSPLQLVGVDGTRVATLLVRGVVALVVLGIAATAFFQIRDALDSVNSIKASVPPVAPTRPEQPQSSPPTEKPAPVGVAARSLLRAGTLRRALATLRGRDLGRITTLRVAPDRVDIQLRTGDGRLRSMQVGPDLALRQLSVTGPGFGQVPSVALASIDPRAPSRLVRTAAARRGVSPARVDYLVVSSFAGAVRWDLFFKDGVHFSGDEHGRNARRL